MAVPKASVDEQGNSPTHKNEIWFAGKPLIVKSITQPCRPQRPSYLHFGAGVRSPHPRHHFGTG